MDARHQENAHDNIPSEKYRDAGFPRYFMTSSTVDNFYKNRQNSKKDKTHWQGVHTEVQHSPSVGYL